MYIHRNNIRIYFLILATYSIAKRRAWYFSRHTHTDAHVIACYPVGTSDCVIVT